MLLPLWTSFLYCVYRFGPSPLARSIRLHKCTIILFRSGVPSAGTIISTLFAPPGVDTDDESDEDEKSSAPELVPSPSSFRPSFTLRALLLPTSRLARENASAKKRIKDEFALAIEEVEGSKHVKSRGKLRRVRILSHNETPETTVNPIPVTESLDSDRYLSPPAQEDDHAYYDVKNRSRKGLADEVIVLLRELIAEASTVQRYVTEANELNGPQKAPLATVIQPSDVCQQTNDMANGKIPNSGTLESMSRTGPTREQSLVNANREIAQSQHCESSSHAHLLNRPYYDSPAVHRKPPGNAIRSSSPESLNSSRFAMHPIFQTSGNTAQTVHPTHGKSHCSGLQDETYPSRTPCPAPPQLNDQHDHYQGPPPPRYPHPSVLQPWQPYYPTSRSPRQAHDQCRKIFLRQTAMNDQPSTAPSERTRSEDNNGTESSAGPTMNSGISPGSPSRSSLVNPWNGIIIDSTDINPQLNCISQYLKSDGLHLRATPSSSKLRIHTVTPDQTSMHASVTRQSPVSMLSMSSVQREPKGHVAEVISSVRDDIKRPPHEKEEIISPHERNNFKESQYSQRNGSERIGPIETKQPELERWLYEREGINILELEREAIHARHCPERARGNESGRTASSLVLQEDERLLDRPDGGIEVKSTENIHGLMVRGTAMEESERRLNSDILKVTTLHSRVPETDSISPNEQNDKSQAKHLRQTNESLAVSGYKLNEDSEIIQFSPGSRDSSGGESSAQDPLVVIQCLKALGTCIELALVLDSKTSADSDETAMPAVFAKTVQVLIQCMIGQRDLLTGMIDLVGDENATSIKAFLEDLHAIRRHLTVESLLPGRTNKFALNTLLTEAKRSFHITSISSIFGQLLSLADYLSPVVMKLVDDILQEVQKENLTVTGLVRCILALQRELRVVAVQTSNASIVTKLSVIDDLAKQLLHVLHTPTKSEEIESTTNHQGCYGESNNSPERCASHAIDIDRARQRLQIPRMGNCIDDNAEFQMDSKT